MQEIFKKKQESSRKTKPEERLCERGGEWKRQKEMKWGQQRMSSTMYGKRSMVEKKLLMKNLCQIEKTGFFPSFSFSHVVSFSNEHDGIESHISSSNFLCALPVHIHINKHRLKKEAFKCIHKNKHFQSEKTESIFISHRFVDFKEKRPKNDRKLFDQIRFSNSI